MKSRVILRLVLLFTCVIAAMASHCQTISGVINNYYRVTAINPLTSSVTVSNASGLAPGVKVLMIQMKGATINTTNTSSFGSINSLHNAGNYEMNYICGISGNTVSFQYQILRSYDASDLVQLITVPQFTSVTVTDTVKALPWNSGTGTGGVIVMEASGTVFLNAPVDASASGFEGGGINNYGGCVWSTNVVDYGLPLSPADANINGAKKGEGIAAFVLNNEYARGKQSNGGGGGNNHNTGGGGGSNYGAGGLGGTRSGETFFACHGTNPGVGGVSLSGLGYTLANNRIFMGGGGGAGHENNSVATPGGNGGGIIMIKANSIVVGGGKFLANGGNGRNPVCSNPIVAEGDGAGGGGGGGSIMLDIINYSGALLAEAKGADGSISGNATNNCTGPGGGGGGGVVWISGASVPAALSGNINVAGGAAGFIAIANSGGCGGQTNGALAGTAGISNTGFTIPVANNFVCAPLASANIIYFKAAADGRSNHLSWLLKDQKEVMYLEIEKSVSGMNFISIGKLAADKINFTDLAILQNSLYRLKVVYIDGSIDYSAVAAVASAPNNSWFTTNPNPASDLLRVTVQADSSGITRLDIYNLHGQMMKSWSVRLQKGFNQISISLPQLPDGSYYLSLNQNGRKYIRHILIHQNR